MGSKRIFLLCSTAIAIALAGMGCGLVGDPDFNRCQATAERQIGLLKDEALRLIPVSEVVSTSEFVGCDSADNGASLWADVPHGIPVEKILGRFRENGWKSLPAHESGEVSDQSMCGGCIAGVMRVVQKKVMYVAVYEAKNDPANWSLKMDFQGLGLFTK